MRGPVNQVVEGNSPFTELQLLRADIRERADEETFSAEPDGHVLHSAPGRQFRGEPLGLVRGRGPPQPNCVLDSTGGRIPSGFLGQKYFGCAVV